MTYPRIVCHVLVASWLALVGVVVEARVGGSSSLLGRFLTGTLDLAEESAAPPAPGNDETTRKSGIFTFPGMDGGDEPPQPAQEEEQQQPTRGTEFQIPGTGFNPADNGAKLPIEFLPEQEPLYTTTLPEESPVSNTNEDNASRVTTLYSGGATGTASRPVAPAAPEVVTLDLKELESHCWLQIEFFDGKGRQATPEEITALLVEAERFFTDLYQYDNRTAAEFLTFDISSWRVNHGDDMVNIYLNEFLVDYNVTMTFVAQSQVGNPTVDLIHKQANFTNLIMNYIWHSPPFKQNIFWQTRRAKTHCRSGGRVMGRV